MEKEHLLHGDKSWRNHFCIYAFVWQFTLSYTTERSVAPWRLFQYVQSQHQRNQL